MPTVGRVAGSSLSPDSGAAAAAGAAEPLDVSPFEQQLHPAASAVAATVTTMSIDRMMCLRQMTGSRIRRLARFLAGELQRADEIRQPVDLHLSEPLHQAVADFIGCRRIDEQGGADADGGRAGEDEFGGVLPGLDAAHADDRDAGVP